MKATFVEVSGFSEVREKFLPDPMFTMIQLSLMADPGLGDVMPGCGGLRKLRIADENRRKGTRGGARMIYLHVPEVNRFYLIDLYGKNEQTDLTPADKKAFTKLAKAIKAAAIAESRSKQKD